MQVGGRRRCVLHGERSGAEEPRAARPQHGRNLGAEEVMEDCVEPNRNRTELGAGVGCRGPMEGPKKYILKNYEEEEETEEEEAVAAAARRGAS